MNKVNAALGPMALLVLSFVLGGLGIFALQHQSSAGFETALTCFALAIAPWVYLFHLYREHKERKKE